VLTGPRTVYRPKTEQITVKLTALGLALLDALCTRTGLRRADALEGLLRLFADKVTKEKAQKTS
jgi:hypothetical protein